MKRRREVEQHSLASEQEDEDDEVRTSNPRPTAHMHSTRGHCNIQLHSSTFTVTTRSAVVRSDRIASR